MLQFLIVLLFSSISFLANADEEKILNIYGWANFIPPEIIKKFEQSSNIKVIYDVYDSDQILNAKLMSGKTEYDLVMPTDSPFLGKEIKLGVYQPINKTSLKNYHYINPDILRQLSIDDPKNTYSIPWLINTVGIGYDVDKVKKLLPNASLNSLSLIFNPKNAEKLSECGIGLINASTEVISAALVYIGLNPNSSNPEDLDKAKDVLLKIRPYIREINSSDYIANFANGDLCVIFGYSGDIFQGIRRAKEAGKNNLEYILPKEGYMVAYDMLAIPTHAKHPNNALKFIEFLLEPKITAQTSNYSGFPSTITASHKFLDPNIRNNQYFFPSNQLFKKSYRSALQSSNFVRKRNRTWTNFVSSY
jgi:putrescine transport system substrate-binding protein